MPMRHEAEAGQSMRRAAAAISGTNCDARNSESSPIGRLM